MSESGPLGDAAWSADAMGGTAQQVPQSIARPESSRSARATRRASELTLGTIVTVLRGLDNSITIASLSSRLNVSASTLNRTRDGHWPPSITFGALRAAFYHYKAVLFGESEELAAAAIIDQLELAGFDPASFRFQYERYGFDDLVTFLLFSASRASEQATEDEGDAAAAAAEAGGAGDAGGAALGGEAGVAAAATAALADAADAHSVARTFADGGASDERLPADASAGAPDHMGRQTAADAFADEQAADSPTKQLTSTNIVIAVLVAAVLLAGTMSLSMKDVFAWIFGHPALFTGISLGIAVLPAALGLSVDGFLCWRAFKAKHPDARLSWNAYSLVSKYGSDTRVVPGAGRFDANLRHVVHHVACNLLGMSCYLLLLLTLSALPNFLEFVGSRNWVEMCKVLAAVAFLIAYNNAITLSGLPRPVVQNPLEDNPDNYRFDRFHVIANIVHLTWTISLASIGVLCFFAYGINNAQAADLPIEAVAVTLATIAFLYLANLSPYAMLTKSVSVGSAGIGIALACVSTLLASVLCFRLCWVTVVETAVCVAALTYLVAWLLMRRRLKAYSWMRRFRASAWYSIVFVLVICAMLIADVLLG